MTVFGGIDLAADPARTAVALVSDDPSTGRVHVESVRLGADDDVLLDLVARSTRTGVDVPLGWPKPYVDLLQAHANGAVAPPPDSGPDWRRTMAMRRTDLAVRARLGLVPLSVSTDRIAHPALRWAALEARLTGLGMDCRRDGAGAVCEVYPAAALRAWGLPHRGYKREAAEAREHLVAALGERLPWFDWNGHDAACIASDDVLDAVLAAVVARESSGGRTERPAVQERDFALQEGWIHVPS